MPSASGVAMDQFPKASTVVVCSVMPPSPMVTVAPGTPLPESTGDAWLVRKTVGEASPTGVVMPGMTGGATWCTTSCTTLTTGGTGASTDFAVGAGVGVAVNTGFGLAV